MTNEAVAAGRPDDGPWVERWLSNPRLQRYLLDAGQDRRRALDLYDWNARISAAVLRDLAHLEVALRNAYDRALDASAPIGTAHWTLAATSVFPPLYRTRRVGGTRRSVDVNRQSRSLLEAAVKGAGGSMAPPGKVIANLTFGFWRYLSSRAHEKSLWVPYLHDAFAAGVSRSEVDDRVGRLHRLRNRVAHHEPLLGAPLTDRLEDLVWVAKQLDEPLAEYVSGTTDVPSLLASRP
jgi:hypothetical protein